MLSTLAVGIARAATELREVAGDGLGLVDVEALDAVDADPAQHLQSPGILHLVHRWTLQASERGPPGAEVVQGEVAVLGAKALDESPPAPGCQWPWFP